MRTDEYAKFVEHCNFTKDKRDAQLLAALGLSGETGEVGELIQTHVDQERLIIEGAVRTGRIAELVKKNLIHGKPLDLTRLKDELGDVLWYFFHALNTYGLTFEEVAVGNVEKLCERHHESNGNPEDWISSDTSNLTKHLDREWAAKGWPTEGDDMQAHIYRNLKALLGVFSAENHSGSSAPYVVSLFEKLAMFEPIGPLTGVDAEWVEVSDGMFQNNRCSHVFKENGEAYDIQGKVFREPDGATYTSYDSRTPVVFPYTPTTEYVDVEAE